MRTVDLQPTHENVLELFEKDMLSRNIDVLRFTELLNSIESSCSIALDARWGAGKTFFVKVNPASFGSAGRMFHRVNKGR